MNGWMDGWMISFTEHSLMPGTVRALQMVMLLQHLAGEALHPESKLSQEGMAGKAVYFLLQEGKKPSPATALLTGPLFPHTPP